MQQLTLDTVPFLIDLCLYIYSAPIMATCRFILVVRLSPLRIALYVVGLISGLSIHTHTLAMDGTVPPAINLTPHLVCLHSLLSLSVGALVVYRRHTICSQWELVVRGIFNQTCCLLTGPPTKHERELSNTTTRVCPFFSIHIASLQTPSCSYVIEFDPRPCSTMWLMCSRLATFGALFFSLTHTSHTRTTLYAMNECKYRSKSERMNTILEGSWSWPLELRAQDVALAVAS